MDQTLYYLNADGSCSQRTVSADQDVPVTDPEGSVRITEDEHAQAVAVMSEAREKVREAAAAAAEELVSADYAALIAVGIPHLTAQRLSGHQPDRAGPGPGDGPGLPPLGVRVAGGKP